MIGIARSITRELGARGITATVVVPGVVLTDMFNEVSDEVKQKYMEDIPAGRFAEPSEIANVVRWLAGDEASYISGAVIPVDGGASMGH